MKAAKYTPEQTKLIDYQAMNEGAKKLRRTPYDRVHCAKHQGNQWFMEEKAIKFENTISPTCRCYDDGKMETIRHVILCKSRVKSTRRK